MEFIKTDEFLFVRGAQVHPQPHSLLYNWTWKFSIHSVFSCIRGTRTPSTIFDPSSLQPFATSHKFIHKLQTANWPVWRRPVRQTAFLFFSSPVSSWTGSSGLSTKVRPQGVTTLSRPSQRVQSLVKHTPDKYNSRALSIIFTARRDNLRDSIVLTFFVLARKRYRIVRFFFFFKIHNYSVTLYEFLDFLHFEVDPVQFLLRLIFYSFFHGPASANFCPATRLFRFLWISLESRSHFVQDILRWLDLRKEFLLVSTIRNNLRKTTLGSIIDTPLG